MMMDEEMDEMSVMLLAGGLWNFIENFSQDKVFKKMILTNGCRVWLL